MDASYDGSFGSFSAGGKNLGGEVFDGEKNDVANNEIKLEQSAGDFNSTDLAVDHSKVADKAINIEPVDSAATDNQAADIVLTNNEVSSANTGAIDSADVTNSADITNSADVTDSASSSVTDPVGAVSSTGSVLVNDVATNTTPSSGAAINDGGVNTTSTNSAITNTNTTSNFAANSGTMTNSYAVGNNSTSTAMNSMLGSGTMGSGMMNGGVNNAGMMGSSMTNWSTAGNADRNAPIVSVDANGVNLPNATDAKSPKKGLIIGAIVIVLLALVGALVGFIFTGKGGGGQTVAAKPLKEAFNSYVNYIWYGKDSDEDFDSYRLSETMPYSLTVKKEEIEINSYILIANEKYKSFEAAYYQNDFGTESTDDLADFFQDYIVFPKPNTKKILEEYLKSGYDATVSYIDNTYSIEKNSPNFTNYASAVNEEMKTILAVGAQANSFGCIRDAQINYTCFSLSDELKNKLGTTTLNTINAEETLQSVAYSTLYNIYAEVYDNNTGGAK